jgi:hypothetical protein
MMELYGELPTSSVVFAAADKKYFEEHASSFVYSADAVGKDVHIHVINPDEDTFSLACILNATTKVRTTFSFEETELPSNAEMRRTYYACLRFYVLPYIVQHAKKVLVLDIDCMVMRPFDFPNKLAGYFPREPLPGTTGWEQSGTRAAAGAVYVSSVGIAKAISYELNGMVLRWFVDQVALSNVFEKLPEEEVHKFDSNFMDWEFVEGTTIWTGKGPRKYENAKYLQAKRSFDLFPDKTREIKQVVMKPRLDTSFKKTGLFVRGKMTHKIRKYWEMFAEKIKSEHPEQTLIIECPRWMFTANIQKYFSMDVKFYVPHVEKHNFNGNRNTLYYMQTVFPWRFTVDPQGWGGGAKFLETYNPNAPFDDKLFNQLREYALNGGSKFDQPNQTMEVEGEYIFVPLQLPHDEAIKWHSNISCEQFVDALCSWTKQNEYAPKIIFKGHPANITSMQPLADIIKRHASDKCVYVTDVNLHKMIEKATAVYIINSGTGQEAMLHGKPVAAFGRCEYEGAVVKGKLDMLDETWGCILAEKQDDLITRYKGWYHWWGENTVNVHA